MRRISGVLGATAVALAAVLVAGPAAATPVLAATTSPLPTAATTGVVAGAALTPMAGGTVTASGVVANKVITGDVLFTGSNLTLKNVRVTGEAIFRGDGVVVEDSELGALSLSGTAGVRISRVEVSGALGRDGIHITSDSGRASDVLIEDTWVHNPMPRPESHYDGLQVRGVDRLTLRRVAVDLGAFAPQHNAALFLENANGGNHGITVESSSLRGGGYVTYTFATDVRVRGSVLGGGNWGNLFPSSPVASIVEFVGNTTPDGATLGYTTAGTPAIVPASGPDTERLAGAFWDVPSNHPFAGQITWLVGEKVTTGYGDGSFRPGAAVTRQAMAAFLHRFAGSPAFTAPAVSPFADVPTSHPFYREIAWLAAEGISTGTTTRDGVLFQPSSAVSREAMAAFLHRFAGEPQLDGTASGFADVPAASAFAAEIAWLADEGIATGTATSSGTVFSPAAPVTREAMAAFLQRTDANVLG